MNRPALSLALGAVLATAGGCLTRIVKESVGTVTGTVGVLLPGGDRAPASGQITCDLRVVDVANARAVGQASAVGPSGELPQLARRLAGQIVRAVPDKNRKIAVLTLRDRSKSATSPAVCEEVGDKLVGALVEARWFVVLERIDVKGVLDEKDIQTAQLDSAEIVNNPALRGKIAGAQYVIVGGVTIAQAEERR